MKKIKKIVRYIDSCTQCPHSNRTGNWMIRLCWKLGREIDTRDGIPPDCPLEDSEE
jgi:hypothetical protein